MILARDRVEILAHRERREDPHAGVTGDAVLAAHDGLYPPGLRAASGRELTVALKGSAQPVKRPDRGRLFANEAPLRVEHASVKLNLVAGLNYDLGRHDLNVSDRGIRLRNEIGRAA